jgi:hypothetical protein
MAVGLFLMGGILQVFVSSKASYRVGEANSRVQENGRFAVQMLAADLRGARSTGCRSMALDEAQDSLNVVACELRDPTDAQSVCEGARAIGSDRPLGYAASESAAANWLAALPGNRSIGAEAKVASQWLRGDVLVAWGTSGEHVYAGPRPNVADADLSWPVALVTPHKDLVGGRLALITDCEATDIFTITTPNRCGDDGLDPPDELAHETWFDPDGGSEECDEGATTVQVNANPELGRAFNRLGTETSSGTTLRARVFPFEFSVFYLCCVDSRDGAIETGSAVDSCDAPSSRYRPALCRWSTSTIPRVQQLVFDVADMRVTYDGFVDQVGGPRLLDLADDVTDAAWISAQGYWGRVDSARIQILATTAEEVRTEASVPNPSAYTAADLGYGLAADRRIYHAFDVTAAIRSSSPWFLPP